MDRKKDIIKKIHMLSGCWSSYEVFSAWVKLMALAIQNQCCFIRGKIWQQREQEYIKTIGRFGNKAGQMIEMAMMLTETMDERMGDILGEIYMELGCGNKNTGQFFTPYHVSLATAKMTLPGKDELKDGKRIKVNEPSCGSGGMIIATAQVMKEMGINYQQNMQVVAQDLDWKAIYMCYVQLSLYGIDAVVAQGNTLTESDYRRFSKECIFRTPRNMGILL